MVNGAFRPSFQKNQFLKEKLFPIMIFQQKIISLLNWRKSNQIETTLTIARYSGIISDQIQFATNRYQCEL